MSVKLSYLRVRCPVNPALLLVTNLALGEEPLLKETKSRFVLFPIQYHEVSDAFLMHVMVLIVI